VIASFGLGAVIWIFGVAGMSRPKSGISTAKNGRSKFEFAVLRHFQYDPMEGWIMA
jgi:hypothetical protein